MLVRRAQLAAAPCSRAKRPGGATLAGVASMSTAVPSRLRFVQVNAFADRPFGGNPAAVFLVPPPLHAAVHPEGGGSCLYQRAGRRGPVWSVGDGIMQKIAAEMKLSETAFVTPADAACSFSESQRFLLRWFTPTKEVDLCGHATLAAAAALTLECGNAAAVCSFDTRSGTLTATRNGTNRFELELPANHAMPSPDTGAAHHHTIARMAVGEHADAIAQLAYSPATKKLVVRMDPTRFSRTDLEAMDVPAVDKMMAVSQSAEFSVTGVMVTLREDQGRYHFISRYFAPWNGIPEVTRSPLLSLSLHSWSIHSRSPSLVLARHSMHDSFHDDSPQPTLDGGPVAMSVCKQDPVTGAAHSVLAPFWLRELGLAWEPGLQLTARQCSPRGGDMVITLVDDEGKRLKVEGTALVLMDGTLRLRQ